MIPFFRKIRKRLADDNKPIKYLRYAIGEIILVVIGILIALQVNNWNEKRKNTAKHKAVLEQIYTVLDQDIQAMEAVENGLIRKTSLIDNILYHKPKIDLKMLPSLLYYIDAFPDSFISETNYQKNFLEFNQDNIAQNSLSKSIATYSSDKLDFKPFSTKHLTQLLRLHNLPEPSLLFGFSILNNFGAVDRGFFTQEQQEIALKVIDDIQVINALKSAKSQNELSIIMVQNKKNDALSNLNLIKNFYPNVKLLYQNLGIVGNATKFKNYQDNVPLNLINPELSIWEGTVKLNEGSVKFREGNSWLANWGGDSFPNGNAKWFGENITVKSGYYHITINLTEKSYHFELIHQ